MRPERWSISADDMAARFPGGAAILAAGPRSPRSQGSRQSDILPGFMMPFGSSARLTVWMALVSAALRQKARKDFPERSDAVFGEERRFGVTGRRSFQQGIGADDDAQLAVAELSGVIGAAFGPVRAGRRSQRGIRRSGKRGRCASAARSCSRATARAVPPARAKRQSPRRQSNYVRGPRRASLPRLVQAPAHRFP